jgi:hypothetical protein
MTQSPNPSSVIHPLLSPHGDMPAAANGNVRRFTSKAKTGSQDRITTHKVV